MVSFAEIENLIVKRLPTSHVQVSNLTDNKDHLHLNIMVISDAFEGKKLIHQHQMIMDILKERLASQEIHAVKIKTLTREKAKRQGYFKEHS